jgi:hypothetical protein
MTIIAPDDEFTRDWDWFAVDPAGCIGHFTTAGMRPLPASVKLDKEAASQLIDYFFTSACKSIPYSVRPDAERDCGGWRDDAARSWYLKDFTLMASTGLFSYNANVSGSKDHYFLVAIPSEPLRVEQLPEPVRDLVSRTKSPIIFADAPYIQEVHTHTW